MLHRTLSQVIDRWAGSHPEVAMFAVILTAPAAAAAEAAVRALAEYVVEVNPTLTGWRVTRIDVQTARTRATRT